MSRANSHRQRCAADGVTTDENLRANASIRP